jgi:hypothetical protein
MVATAVLLLVHVPAPARSVRATGTPIHIGDDAPDIAEGAAVTVIDVVAVPAHAPVPFAAVITFVVVVVIVVGLYQTFETDVPAVYAVVRPELVYSPALGDQTSGI